MKTHQPLALTITQTLAKLSAPLLFGLTMQAVAQNTPAPNATPKATHSAVHNTLAHRHTPARRAVHSDVICPPAPVVPPGIPAAAGPVRTAFALRYTDIKLGTGAEAAPGDSFTVHYTGWLASDGTKFDSSVDRGQPFTFLQGVHGVIAGWDQGFDGMRVGGKRRLFIPYQLAYGDAGHPPVIPPKSDLIFDIELLDATNPSAAPAAGPQQ